MFQLKKKNENMADCPMQLSGQSRSVPEGVWVKELKEEE